jgi:DNA-binding MarR family transcriptional regulator/GNAT superfamily N-acetyltransferase
MNPIIKGIFIMLNLEAIGLSGLGTRFKRLSDLLFRQSDELYRAHNIKLPSRAFPLMQLLAAHGNLSVTHLADLLGQTHPAVSQMSKKLEQQGWLYHEIDASDERRRLLALSPQGYEMVDRLKPLWSQLETVLNRILEVSSYGLLENIELLERELGKTSIAERVAQLVRQEQQDRVEIIHYEPRYHDDFYRLNRQWLDKYLYIEPHEHEVLTDPESQIIQKGGFILLARLDGQIIGTTALLASADNHLELSKMSVEETYQGLGVGEKLARAAINQYRATDYTCLFLLSNRRLLPALNLYYKLGFVEYPDKLNGSDNGQADIYMELDDTA